MSTPSILTTLEEALQQVEQRLQPPPPAWHDSAVVIRVVGEFSSGKSRFLTELFGDTIPTPLQPISAPTRETLVPLEITHGESIALSLIHRPSDRAQAQVLDTFDEFPDREAQRALFQRHRVAEGECRLRLEVPEPRLLWEEDGQVTRLFLLDTPGWNSGEEDPSVEDIRSATQPMLVHVVRGDRLQSRDDLEHLVSLVEALEESYSDEFPERYIFTCVTSFPDAEDPTRLEDALDELEARLADEALDEGVYVCPFLGIDLAQASTAQREQLREAFWTRLREALAQPALERPQTAQTSAPLMGPTQELADAIAQLAAQLHTTENLLNALSRQGATWLPGENIRRLRPHNPERRGERLREAWTHTCDGLSLENIELPPCPNRESALEPWWDGPLRQRIAPVSRTCRALQAEVIRHLDALSANLPDDERVDLNALLQQRCADALSCAAHEVRLANSMFPESLREHMRLKSATPEQIMTTLLAITIGQGVLIEAATL